MALFTNKSGLFTDNFFLIFPLSLLFNLFIIGYPLGTTLAAIGMSAVSAGLLATLITLIAAFCLTVTLCSLFFGDVAFRLIASSYKSTSHLEFHVAAKTGQSQHSRILNDEHNETNNEENQLIIHSAETPKS